MAFDWNEYIILAVQLNSGTPTEAQMRSATSRAYYGAFIQVRNKKGKSMEKDAAVHLIIINELKASDVPEELSIGNLLHDLRKKRNDADYDGIKYKPTPQDTNSHILKAQNIVKNLAFIQMH